jgi:hypothetical protein
MRWRAVKQVVPLMGRQIVNLTPHQAAISRWLPSFAFLHCALLALLLVTLSQSVLAQDIAKHGEERATAMPVGKLVQILTRGSFRLTDKSGTTLGTHQQDGNSVPVSLSVGGIVQTLQTTRGATDSVAKLWEFFANEENTSFVTLPIIESLIGATDTRQSRAALWSELAYLMRQSKGKRKRRAKSLLGLFERHSKRFRPLLIKGRDTEIGGDEMIDLMLSSRIFGSNFKESLEWVSEHKPAAVARRIEFERGRGRPARWENTAFKEILKWKNARFSSDATKAPGSLAELESVGETYIIIFNNLHDMNSKYRNSMLRGLSAADAFNVVISGEFELYRMGTSSYREYLHHVIMDGIREKGSFEEFVQQTIPDNFGQGARNASRQRSMVYLRVVSMFGLLEDVLETVRDRDTFIDRSLASLGDPTTFERNGSVIVDLLTARAPSKAIAEFKALLINKLYGRYRLEQEPILRNVFGSMLSVYQTVTGDRREAAIDQAFPLDRQMFHIPFDRLFSKSSEQRLVHRMFMRMDEDTDAISTYSGFHSMMRSRRASIESRRHHVVYRFKSGKRLVEIYVNRPTSLGKQRGIAEIAKALRGKRVQTVIGRGHTYIINPLMKDARLVLGDQVNDVAAVMVGSCGGEASMRDLIQTFGYTSVVTTRSTGRQLINNAIIGRYVNSLLSLQPGNRLFLNDVLKKAVTQFSRRGTSSDLRNDASFYRLSMSAVLTAFLFDTHVRRFTQRTVQ